MIYTPHIAHSSLWDVSGHSSFYSDSMFGKFLEHDQEEVGVAGDGSKEFRVRPMNCPFHCLLFKVGYDFYHVCIYENMIW